MFASLNDAWQHDPVKDMTNKMTNCYMNKCSKSSDPSSDTQSDIYKFTNNNETIDLSDMTTLNLLTDTPKKAHSKKILSNTSDDEDKICNLHIKHIKKCQKCYSKIKKIINMKEKNNNFIPISDSWKETLIIICGAVIALFLIFLISKSISN